ncbi:MAG: J domain-containing protein [Clostridia bacterium]|nr:J domain-containing protein [Clostridia bacterium]
MNYYEVLGVSETATNKEIKKAYKTLVKKYHPDVFKGEKSFAEEKIKQINEAYDTLIDTSLRQKYDKSLFVPDFSNTDADNSSKISYYNDETFSKYEDLYKYDYYKRYTTNYYGISRDDLRFKKSKMESQNSPVKDSDFFTDSKSSFMIIIALGIVILLIIIWFLLSYLNNMLSKNINDIKKDNTTYNSDYYYDREIQNIYNILFNEAY